MNIRHPFSTKNSHQELINNPILWASRFWPFCIYNIGLSVISLVLLLFSSFLAISFSTVSSVLLFSYWLYLQSTTSVSQFISGGDLEVQMRKKAILNVLIVVMHFITPILICPGYFALNFFFFSPLSVFFILMFFSEDMDFISFFKTIVGVLVNLLMAGLFYTPSLLLYFFLFNIGLGSFLTPEIVFLVSAVISPFVLAGLHHLFVMLSFSQAEELSVETTRIFVYSLHTVSVVLLFAALNFFRTYLVPSSYYMSIVSFIILLAYYTRFLYPQLLSKMQTVKAKPID